MILNKFHFNVKAINLPHWVFHANEFKPKACESAKEIWEKLVATHEVKNFHISVLTRSCDLFTTNDRESIVAMFTRFTDV